MVNKLVNIENENKKVAALLRLVAQRRESLFSFENKPEKSKADASVFNDPKLSKKNKEKQHGIYENIPDEKNKADTSALDEQVLQVTVKNPFEDKSEPVHSPSDDETLSVDHENNDDEDKNPKKSNVIRISDCSVGNDQGFVNKMAQAFNEKLTRNSKSSEMEFGRMSSAKSSISGDNKDSEIMKYKTEIERLKAEIKRLKEENIKNRYEKRQDKMDECEQMIKDCNEEIQRNMRSINEAEMSQNSLYNKISVKKEKNGEEYVFIEENCDYEEVDKIDIKYELNRYDAVVGDQTIFKNKEKNQDLEEEYIDDKEEIRDIKDSGDLETESGGLSIENEHVNNEVLKKVKLFNTIGNNKKKEDTKNRKSKAESITAPQNTVQHTPLSHPNLGNHNFKTKQKVPAKIIRSDFKPYPRVSQNNNKIMDSSKPLIVDARAGDSTSCQISDSGVFENQPVKKSIAHFSALEKAPQNVEAGVFENKPAESDLRGKLENLQKSDSGVFENKPAESDLRNKVDDIQKSDSGVFENKPVESDLRGKVDDIQKSDSGVFENQPSSPQSPLGDSSLNKVESGVFENQPVKKSIAHFSALEKAPQNVEAGVFENKPAESTIRSSLASLKIHSGVFENQPVKSTLRSSLAEGNSQVSPRNDSSNKKPSVFVRQSSKQSNDKFNILSNRSGSEVLFENVPSDTFATVRSFDVLPEFDRGTNVFEKKPSSSFTDFKADQPVPNNLPDKDFGSKVFDDYEIVNSELGGDVFAVGEKGKLDKKNILDYIQDAVSEVKKDHKSKLQS